MKETIFFVEDDKSIHALIKAALELNGYDACGFTDPLDFIEALKTKVPDLLILDVMLPHMSGYEVMNYLQENDEYANLPVIILSALSDELDIVRGLKCGAADYVSKPFGVLELMARIRTNLLKAHPVHAKKTTLRVRKLVLNNDKRECTLEGKIVPLTAKEFELLSILVENSPRVVPRAELFNKVWDYECEIETRTLDMHVNTIRKKIAAITSEQYVVTVRSVGYVVYGEE